MFPIKFVGAAVGGKLNLWGLLWAKDTYIVTRIKGLL
eukprot:SAG31_NODE_47065_length_251_cov_5.605263_1_plen_36_part_01